MKDTNNPNESQNQKITPVGGGGSNNPDKKPKKISFKKKFENHIITVQEKLYFLYAFFLLFIVLIVLAVLYFSSAVKVRALTHELKTTSISLKQALEPKFDEQTDLLLKQCQNTGVYCFASQTNRPNLELLKFLLNFKEIPNYKYRLFMEISIPNGAMDIEQKQANVLECNGVNTDFYVCQEITSARPTDVIRSFEVSYAKLPQNVQYNVRLMVKPISLIDPSHSNSSVSPDPSVGAQSFHVAEFIPDTHPSSEVGQIVDVSSSEVVEQSVQN